MDYINYVKQSPVQGVTGLWGGSSGALMSGGAKEYKWYGSRATFGGGWQLENNIQYLSVGSLGNSSSFGNIGPSPAWKRYNIQQGGP